MNPEIEYNNYIANYTNATGSYGTAITIGASVTGTDISDNTLYNNRVDISDAGTNTRISKPTGTNLAIGALDNTPDGTLEIIKQSTTPLLMLSSSADANGDYVYAGNDGKIGIGTTSPTSKFHVTGAVTGKALAIFDETGDQAILTASSSAVTRFTVNHYGLADATVGGLATYTKAGTISDVDFSDTAIDGLFGFDTTNHRLYFREGGAWSYIAKTGGFQIPTEETEGLTTGDLLLPYVESKMNDGALHGLYKKLDITDLLTANQLEIINDQVVFNNKITSDVSTLQTTVESLQDFISNLQKSVSDFADEIFTKKVHTQEICVGEKDLETCINKDKLDEIINNLPSPTPTSQVEATPVTSEVPTTTVSPSPTAGPSVAVQPTTESSSQPVSSPSATPNVN